MICHAVSILRGIKEKYENHHKVLIKDAAIINAVELSQRYITERHLPDKAIDLIDEAASKLRMEINSKPEELDEIERKIMQLEIEKEAIKREKDKKKVSHIEKELADLTEQRDAFKAKWKTEKDIVDTIQTNKENIERYKLEAEQAERAGFDTRVANSWLGKELRSSRNFAGYMHTFGALLGSAAVWFDQTIMRGNMPFTLRDRKPDHACLQPASVSKKIAYPKPDNVITFDRLSSVFLSNTNHEEDQPCHLQLVDSSIPIQVNLPKYDEPAQRYCPAGVYEVITDGDEPRFQINAQNCVHCKTCDLLLAAFLVEPFVKLCVFVVECAGLQEALCAREGQVLPDDGKRKINQRLRGVK